MKYKGARKRHAGQTVVEWWITEIRKADKGARKGTEQGLEVGVLSSRGIAWLLQETSKQANSRLTASDETLGSLRMHYGDFPGGTVVKNLPANAGDTGLTHNLGRFHMPQGNWARAPQLLKPAHPRARALQRESSPAHCN